MKKMNKKFLLASLVLATSVASANAADINYYAGGKINYETFEFKDDSEASWSPIGLGLGGGAKYNITNEVFVGGEGYLNYALTNPEDDEIKLKYGLSIEINAIAGYNITEQFNVYGLIGLVNSKPSFERTDEHYHESKTKSNISAQFGFGVGFNAAENIAVKAQYTLSNPNYKWDDEDGDSDKAKNNNISVAVNYVF
ncbi:MAG: outer membrane beta-barrel protein [Rickettsiales bacterium]|jgi:opacity protein-like surface antigen|nr:outer membrane beta-barrel protein [Rickettsiales bacterium]